METIKIHRNSIVTQIKNALRTCGHSEKTIVSYIESAYKLITFMEGNHLDYYTETIGDSFLLNMRHHSIWQVRAYGALINKLNLLLKGEKIHRNLIAKKREFPGQIGKIALDYLEYKRKEGCKTSTIARYRNVLSDFSVSMASQSIDIETLSSSVIFSYLTSIENDLKRKAAVIKTFLKLCYERGFIDGPTSSCLDEFHVKEREKLPSTYSPEEIKALEESVDRSTPIGKRNYAIILCGSRLGMRRSDISNLQFKDIDWDSCTITCTQVKTGEPLVLPLLEVVGEALIDYINGGRPKTKSKHVFVSHSYPENKLEPQVITTMVQRQFRWADIDTGDKHFGPHSLRHSLAQALLDGGIQLPIISKSLGHRSTRSTMYYLNVDLATLIETSLDVPMVDSDFYFQNGGKFYEKD